MKIKMTGQGDYSAHIKNFMKDHGIFKIIGISGGSDDKLRQVSSDDPLQRSYQNYQNMLHERIISEALGTLRGYRVAVLTGGTKWGIPKTACLQAKQLGFVTIGVFPLTGQKYALSDELLDLAICVDPLIGESRWGDEGAVWTSLVDGIIVIGGSMGTLTECAHIGKINEALIKRNEQPKYIVPIYGTGGVAEQLPHLWAKPEIKARSIPSEWVHTGSDAAKLLINQLNLEDHYDPYYFEQQNKGVNHVSIQN